MQLKAEADDLEQEVVVEFEESPTETSQTETPAPKDETPTEPTEADTTESDPTKESDPVQEQRFGKGAEKRIKKLLGEKKEAIKRATDLEQRLAALEAKQRQDEERQAAQHFVQLEERENELKLREDHLRHQLKSAKTEGDIDTEVSLLDALAAIKSEKTIIGLQKKVQPQRPQRPEVEAAPERATQQEAPQQRSRDAVPDKRALQWQKRNPWFGDAGNTGHRLMTQMAFHIHNDLLDEGIGPDVDADEYYAELDRRIQAEFPERFKEKITPAKAGSPVQGGSRAASPNVTKSASGRIKVTLTTSEQLMAKRLGVSNEDYAREKAKRLNLTESN